jgi:hypothetical protein
VLFDHAGLTQDPEVVRGGGLADRQLEGDAGLVVRASGQLVDDPSPHRIRQRGQHGIQLQLVPVGVGEGAHL